MKLTGLHFLLTYRCLYECDHCFVWGSPRQPDTMTTTDVDRLLVQASDLGTVNWIYFEGGEPFLYYASLLDCVKRAADLGFQVGLVSNAYWATNRDDALRCLRPFEGLVQDLSISTDLYHGEKAFSDNARHAVEAAAELGISASTISIALPENDEAESASGQIPAGTSRVMFRGRAAEQLAGDVPHHPWSGFDRCPHEELREPGRVHVDPLGNLHLCQGITIGNVRERSLQEICGGYDPDTHPVVGPLLRGGPVALVTEHDLPHADSYADACHLCYAARLELRRRRVEGLGPDAVYGIVGGNSLGGGTV